MSGPEVGFRLLAEELKKLGIPFMVTGSLASSIHGIYRTTADIDLVADIQLHHISLLSANLEKEFYADPQLMRHGLQHARSFNLIHYASGSKFDIFPLSSDPYQQAQFQRRTLEDSGLGSAGSLLVPVASAEDIILNKLSWYRAGGEVSDRQWNDIRGVIAVRGERLDCDYLRKWASHLGVADLLERVLKPG
jgi:hypothetical protein